MSLAMFSLFGAKTTFPHWVPLPPPPPVTSNRPIVHAVHWYAIS
jgi:hypothetical protein